MMAHRSLALWLGLLVTMSMLSFYMVHQSPNILPDSVLHARVEDFMKVGVPDATSKRQNNSTSTPRTIAYAITLTDCSTSMATYMDGAAVLAYSIHYNSIRSVSSASRYDYKLYAFVHPSAANCTEKLSNVGYNVRILPTPIEVGEIRGPLKDYVHGASCCGAKEFLKLYVYTLLDHPVAVHLDTDMLLLQPLDDLFDSMLEKGPARVAARRRLPTMWYNRSEDLPSKIDSFFTRDYNMMVPGRRSIKSSAVQGGFLVIRPNETTFEAYRETILEGDYKPGQGWGASKKVNIGGFYGAPQIQGLCAYFFGHIHPESSIELNRCRINSMVDSPYSNVKGQEGMCRTQQKECEDCRRTNASDVMLVHFTLCSKPWSCLGPDSLIGRTDQPKTLCLYLHSEWFRYRAEMESEWIREDNNASSLFITSALSSSSSDQISLLLERRKPFCKGNDRYIPIQYPDYAIISHK